MFPKNKPQPDKVNMSLDDIIKLNKKQGNQQRKNTNNGGQNKQKKGFNNKGRQQTFSKKPFGMLNRSKQIQKNKTIRKESVLILKPNGQKTSIGAAGNKVNHTRRLRPVKAQFIANRRRAPNPQSVKTIFNRFGNANSNKPKQANANASNSAPKQHVQQNNNNMNQRRGNRFAPKKQPIRILQQQKKQKQPANNKNKIAMQTARKNVQKAKRLLTARRAPVQQIMTQHYASKLGLTSKMASVNKSLSAIRQQKRRRPQAASGGAGKILTVSINNRFNKTNKTKAFKQQKMQNSVKQTQQIKRPILNRTRPLASSNVSNRMVFY